MEGLEEKLNAVLSNPQMMQQLMSMAQSLGQSPPAQPEEAEPEPPRTMTSPPMDPQFMQRIFGIAKQTGIDRNQQNLLKALGPYLSKDRIIKLERAMRAAKIASIAASFLRSSGISLYSGR
jgi:hypothetical protein